MKTGNLFAGIPPVLEEERMETLLEEDSWTLERIVSRGHATPPGQWYDQARNEWVVLLKGGAGLLVEGEAAPRVMAPGDHILLPAGCRHRVAWTDPEVETVWLALHFPSFSMRPSSIETV